MTRRISWILAIPVLLWVMPSETAFAQATNTLECDNGKSYTVSDGSNGTCSFTYSATGQKTGLSCMDAGGGNRAGATCSGGCAETAGSGSCAKAAAAIPPSGRKPITSGAVTGKPGTAKLSGPQQQGTVKTQTNAAKTNAGSISSGGGTNNKGQALTTQQKLLAPGPLGTGGGAAGGTKSIQPTNAPTSGGLR
jgi:hypothetical protein